MWTFIIYFLMPLLGTVSLFWIAAHFLPLPILITNFFMPFLGVLMGLSVAGAIYGQRRIKQNTLPNLPDELRSREQQIIHLADRIRTGQSSAIIGFFSEERRSILGYLRNENPKQQEDLYSDKANQLIFSYVDIAMDIDKTSSQEQFWERALEPLHLKLDTAYQTCKDNQFNRRSLENIISLINQKGWRLVLLLDKFETLLEYPHFQENWSFFTTLRSLAASRTPSPLALVIANYSSLGDFYKNLQQFSPSVSPVLNFIGETAVLGSLSEAEIDNLLEQNDFSLSQKNRQLIKDMAGGHPYLLKIVVAEFRNTSLNSEAKSFEAIKNPFCERIRPLLENMLKSWPSPTCQAFFRVAQQNTLSDFEKELKELETQGLIIKINAEWQIRSQIFSKCLIGQNAQQLCKK